MSEEMFDYNFYRVNSEEKKSLITELQNPAPIKKERCEKLLDIQFVLLELYRSHHEAQLKLSGTKYGVINKNETERIIDRIIHTNGRINSLYSDMTRIRADRKKYYRKYYQEHKLEIAARFNSAEYKENRKIYAQKNRVHLNYLGVVRKFLLTNKERDDEFFNSLQRCLSKIK